MRFHPLMLAPIGPLMGLISLVACDTTTPEDGTQYDVMDNDPASFEREIHPPEYYIDGYTHTDPTELIPMADMRMVAVRYDDDSTSDSLVHVMHVQRFIDATIALHVDPGVNPYNGEKTKPAVSLVVSRPSFDGPYWHTQPTLDEDASFFDGAQPIRWTIEKVWDVEESRWLFHGDVAFGGF